MKVYRVLHAGESRVVEAPSFAAAVDAWRADSRVEDDGKDATEEAKTAFWEREEPDSVELLSDEPVMREDATITIDVVFDGPPGPEAGRFVEVERDGKGISVGEWVKRDDGYWVLRIPGVRLPVIR